ncbi:hypothetical protein DH2020_004885 [Rehmannia glutinosa]|uniref:Uncharacterized protein n=1 Tax=Rehmannia glutinosa TaxID=99300 RepID=A0ABR0XRC0_REHGL
MAFTNIIYIYIYIFSIKIPCSTRSTRATPDRKPPPICYSQRYSYLSLETIQEIWSTYDVKLGPVPVLVISSAKLAKEALKTIQDLAFSGRPKLLGQQELSYNGVDIAFSPHSDYWREVIEEHLALKRAKNIREDEDDHILDILIRLKQEKSGSIDFNWDHVKALLTDEFIAATDTSAASIVWTMTALIKAPNAMEKVKAEIRNVIGKKGKVDEDDLPKLPYLKAVMNETFRLYPPAPMLVPRQTIEICTLDGYEIQPNTVVFVNAWAIQRDPKNWENPDEFLPERFLNNNIDIKGQDFGIIPFGSGRRICPGMFM